MFDSSKIQPHIAFTDLREWMAEAEKLGGKVEMLNRFFTSKDPDSQKVSEMMLEKYFELPSYASVSDRAVAPTTSDTKAETKPDK